MYLAGSCIGPSKTCVHHWSHRHHLWSVFRVSILQDKPVTPCTNTASSSSVQQGSAQPLLLPPSTCTSPTLVGHPPDGQSVPHIERSLSIYPAPPPPSVMADALPTRTRKQERPPAMRVPIAIAHHSHRTTAGEVCVGIVTITILTHAHPVTQPHSTTIHTLPHRLTPSPSSHHYNIIPTVFICLVTMVYMPIPLPHSYDSVTTLLTSQVVILGRGETRQLGGALAGQPVVEVACGGTHTVALTAAGKVH